MRRRPGDQDGEDFWPFDDDPSASVPGAGWRTSPQTAVPPPRHRGARREVDRSLADEVQVEATPAKAPASGRGKSDRFQFRLSLPDLGLLLLAAVVLVLMALVI